MPVEPYARRDWLSCLSNKLNKGEIMNEVIDDLEYVYYLLQGGETHEAMKYLDEMIFELKTKEK